MPLAAKWRALRPSLCSPTKELSVQTARVLKLLLPGLRIRCSVLTKATAAGTDFGKVRRPAKRGALPRRPVL